jgi:hypothetical protein
MDNVIHIPLDWPDGSLRDATRTCSRRLEDGRRGLADSHSECGVRGTGYSVRVTGCGVGGTGYGVRGTYSGVPSMGIKRFEDIQAWQQARIMTKEI